MNSREPREIAKTISALLDDPEKRKALGAAARERIDSLYAAQDVMKAKDRLFRELIS